MAEQLTELEGPAAARSDRWAKRILASSSAVLLAGGLLGLVVVGGTKAVSPAKELARMQAFVEKAKSARLTATLQSEQREGEGGLGSSYKDTSRMTGAVVLPDRSQWVEEDGTAAYEGITVPGAAYYREADSREELASEQWVHETIDPAEVSGASLSPDLMPAADVATAFAAEDLLDMLEAADAPTRVGPHTIKVRIDVTKLGSFESGDLETPIPVMTAELTSTSEGRLDRLVLHFEEKDEEMGDFSGTADIRFTDWGAPVTIAAPDPATLDPTPGIDEDEIAAFTSFPLLGLRRLPAGYQLLEAYAMTTEEDVEAEDADCPEAALSYGNPAEHAAAEQAAAKIESEEEFEELTWPASIEVSLTPASCDSWNALEDGTPITVGGRPATILRSSETDEEYATSIEVIVGATRVLIESDGPEAATIAAASDLVPFDLATQPVHHEQS